jgi:methionyl-tRNA formyltransferase
MGGAPSQPLRVAFAGTPEFARVALERLHASGFRVPLVLTQPDRPAGRGMKLQAPPVKQFAQSLGIEVVQPRSLRLDGRWPEDAAAACDALHACQPDVLVVAAYGLILPQWVLDLPALGCLNIHASLLPRWRGAAPIHRAIEAADARTGVTIMQMDAGLDTGDMLLAESTVVGPDETTGGLHDRLALLGGRLIVEALERVACGDLRPAPQPQVGVTYAAKIDKAEAAIDWRLPAAALARKVRAFNPSPGAFATLAGETFKLWAARAEVGPSLAMAAPGELLSAGPEGIRVQTGDGALVLTALQRSGGRRLEAREFLRGCPLEAGRRFDVAGG